MSPTKGRENNSSSCPIYKLMVRASICIDKNCTTPTDVWRGMKILSEEGQEIGKVAAVMLDAETRKATHLLLSRLPESRGYWMVPLDRVDQIRDEIILTRVSNNGLEMLPLWHPWE